MKKLVLTSYRPVFSSNEVAEYSLGTYNEIFWAEMKKLILTSYRPVFPSNEVAELR